MNPFNFNVNSLRLCNVPIWQISMCKQKKKNHGNLHIQEMANSGKSKKQLSVTALTSGKPVEGKGLKGTLRLSGQDRRWPPTMHMNHLLFYLKDKSWKINLSLISLELLALSQTCNCQLTQVWKIIWHSISIMGNVIKVTCNSMLPL